MELELRSERREEGADGGVVTLWLSSPERSLVVLDAWLLDQIHLFFDRLDKEGAPGGFVLMSEGSRVFVAGADLAEIDQLDDHQLNAYLTEGAAAFERISALDCPTVAAINGAALGGGLEIAMHCDALIAALPAAGDKPYRVGLPEASLGLCPGWGGTQMLPARIDPAEAIRMAATGETVKVTDAPEGLFARVINNVADLHEAALHWLDDHAKVASPPVPKVIDETNRDEVAAGLAHVRGELPDTPAAHAVVEAIEIGLRDGWKAAVEAERRLLLSLRHTEFARRQLESFFAKNV